MLSPNVMITTRQNQKILWKNDKVIKDFPVRTVQCKDIHFLLPICNTVKEFSIREEKQMSSRVSVFIPKYIVKYITSQHYCKE